MRSFLLLAAVLPVLALTGCKSACRALADAQCDCLPTQNERDTCYYQNGYAEGGDGEASAETEAYCQEKLETCQCGNTDTAEGKQACGLAR